MVIQAKGLRKTFGATEAVRGLDFSVPQGSICAFLGRNGAGKTTTLKMLQGMVHPTGGEATVLGLRIDDRDESVAIRRRVAFVCEEKGTVAYMKLRKIIDLTKSFYPSWNDGTERILLDRFELNPQQHAGTLSKGMQTKFSLLLAMCRDAELLILDEPSEGLDPASSEDLLQMLVSLAADGKTTIFFSTHHLGDVEQIADRVVIIDHGRTVVEDSLDDLKNNYRRVSMVFDANVPVIAGAQVQGRVASVLLRGGAQDAVERLRKFNPSAIDVHQVALKDIFLDCVKGDRV